MSDQSANNEENESVFPRISAIFKTPFSQRTLAQNQEAIYYLRNIKFFSSKLAEGLNHDKFLQKCSAVMQLVTVDPGTVLYHQGDLASNIYIVIEGKVRRYIPRAFDELIPDGRVVDLLNTKKANQHAHLHQSLEESALRKSILHKPRKGSILENTRRSNASSLNSVSLESSRNKTPGISPQNNISKKMGVGISTPRLSLDKSDAVVPSSCENLQDRLPICRRSQKQAEKIADPKAETNVHSSILISDRNEHLNASYEIAKGEKQTQNNEMEFDEFEVFSKLTNHIHKYFIDGAFRFKHVKTYTNGDVFGELGLAFGSARIATVVAETTCALLTIDRDNFNRIFNEEDSYTKDAIEFIQMMFPQLSNKHISEFAGYVKRLVLYRNQVIYNQDDQTNGIYIIREGEVCLEKFVTAETSPSCKKEQLLQLLGTPRGQIKSFAISNCEFFGEEELLNYSARMYTARVATNKAVVFKITKSALSLLKLLYYDIYSRLVEQAIQKQEWRMKKQENIHQWIQSQLTERSSLPSPEKIKSTNIMKKLDLINADNYLSTKKHKLIPRLSSVDQNFISNEAMRETEREFYKEMASMKPKFVRNKAKIRDAIDSLSPKLDLQLPKSLRLWKIALKQDNTSRSKMLLRNCFGEEIDNLPKQSPRNDAKIIPEKRNHPLLALKPHLKKAVGTKSTHELLAKFEDPENTNPKKESPRPPYQNHYSNLSLNLSSLLHNKEDQKFMQKIVHPDDPTSMLFSVKSYRTGTPESQEFSKNSEKFPTYRSKYPPSSPRKKQIKRNISVSTSLGLPDDSHELLSMPLVGISPRFLSPTPSNLVHDSEYQLKSILIKDQEIELADAPAKPLKRRGKSLPMIQIKHGIPSHHHQVSVSPGGPENQKNLKASHAHLVDSLLTIKHYNSKKV